VAAAAPHQADACSPCPPSPALSQLNGSLARAAIGELLSKGLIKPVAVHGSQKIYTRAGAA
jgi:hypothetical protein